MPGKELDMRVLPENPSDDFLLSILRNVPVPSPISYPNRCFWPTASLLHHSALSFAYHLSHAMALRRFNAGGKKQKELTEDPGKCRGRYNAFVFVYECNVM
jgi:hypothetical protein